MRPRKTFHLDLRRGATPRVAVGGKAPFPETTPPAGGFDRERGLRFPLDEGRGVVFTSNGMVTDTVGSFAVTFTLDEGDAGGCLLETWARYLRVRMHLDGTGLFVTIDLYGHSMQLLSRPRLGEALTLDLDWDCGVGVRARLRAGEEVLVEHARNLTWHAYGVRCFPVVVGGAIASLVPGQRAVVQQFNGWISELTCCDQPLHPPGLSAVDVRGEATSDALPAAPGITVMELHDPLPTDSRLRYDIIPDRLANLKTCRRVHPELAALYFAAPTPLEGLRRLGRYVSGLWPHTEYWPWPREIFEARGDVLLAHIKAGETTGMCGGYAHTMEELCWALGIPARRTQVQGHSSFEVYDHGHDKWMCLETDPECHACHWEGPDGAPLSIGELIDILERDERKPGTYRCCARPVPLGIQVPSGAHNKPDDESWFRRAYTMMYYLKGDYGDPRPVRPLLVYVPAWMRAAWDDPWTPKRLHRPVADWRELYWSCDRVRIAARWRVAGEVLSLRLSAFQAQFLKGFAVRIDDGPERLVKESCDWRLHPGVNRIAIATRNALGAGGHAWRAVVHKG